MIYQNRHEAGQALGHVLQEKVDPQEEIVVFGIPRGGLVVAGEVAKLLKARLGIIIPRKIGAPTNPEMAIGAVTEDGTVLLNDALIKALGIKSDDLEQIIKEERGEISRRMKAYGTESPGDLAGKTVILVDDGIATGFTIQAALRSLRRHQPARLLLAVPVGPREVAALLQPEVDEMICINTPEPFYAVGQFYQEFGQTTDEEVVEILRNNRREIGP